MMTFGFSGSQRLSRQTREHLSGSNYIRAGWLADLVADRRVAIRCVVNGRVETFPNSAFRLAIQGGYTYPRDWIATMQAFEKILRKDFDLLSAAESQGITLEGIGEMIEQIREYEKGKKGEFFDA